METDWSVAAAAGDPLIEIPWRDDATGLAWVDLRVDANTQRERIAAIPEAAASPALARCLALLNAPQGLLLTTKCDRWRLDEEERSDLADVLDQSPSEWGYGTYIDVLMAHALPMSDFLLQEEWARLTALRCAGLPVEDARMEAVVRPARSSDNWGYGLTFYCYGGGANESRADAAWAGALEQATPLLIAAAESLLISRKEIDIGGPLP